MVSCMLAPLLFFILLKSILYNPQLELITRAEHTNRSSIHISHRKKRKKEICQSTVINFYHKTVIKDEPIILKQCEMRKEMGEHVKTLNTTINP